MQVQNPTLCKTNCPACARVCPQKAIIFPKYTESPVNGDEVDEKALQEEKENAQLNKLLDGDIYSAIRGRDKGTGLAKLQKDLGIPAEVLASLSPDELKRIKQKAENHFFTKLMS